MFFCGLRDKNRLTKASLFLYFLFSYLSKKRDVVSYIPFVYQSINLLINYLIILSLMLQLQL